MIKKLIVVAMLIATFGVGIGSVTYAQNTGVSTRHSTHTRRRGKSKAIEWTYRRGRHRRGKSKAIEWTYRRGKAPQRRRR